MEFLMDSIQNNPGKVKTSRVETPQHRVLENTLNMGSYFTWIKRIIFEARHEGI